MNGGLSQNARVLADAGRDLRLHKLARRPHPSDAAINLWWDTKDLSSIPASTSNVGLMIIARDRLNDAIEEALK